MAGIRIVWPAGSVIADLNPGPTVSSLLAVLPVQSSVNTWGEEVYFTLPIKAALEPGAQLGAQRGLDDQDAARGVGNLDAASVEQQLQPFGQAFRLVVRVFWIAQNRVADGLHVGAQLMGPARVGAQGHPGGAVGGPERAPGGDGGYDLGHDGAPLLKTLAGRGKFPGACSTGAAGRRKPGKPWRCRGSTGWSRCCCYLP